MRHYRSRAPILYSVSCVVSRETAILFQFHGVLGTEIAWGWTTDRYADRAGSRSTQTNNALSPLAEDGPPCEALSQRRRGLPARKSMMGCGGRLWREVLRANLDDLTRGRCGIPSQER